MRRIELLAPAGSMEALIAAVQNGCDAVYLGGNRFNARAFSDNFNEEAMIEAIRYAHGYGVKVYVTMNTILYEEEMDEAIAYVKFLYQQGADALIIQDIGLFDVVHQCFPDMELHASTQMHIHNEAGIRQLAKWGFSRIVLPRETPIEEVRRYASLGVELEVFVQGALCVSYSGQCLMSAKKLSRSGNRGACAQMCRMQYRLGYEKAGNLYYVKQDGDYLISPKDLNTLKHIPQLIEAGVTSFKIEGRMKRAEYVAQMTMLYRQAIDAYEAHCPTDSAAAEANMRKIFNRGFTSGCLFHQQGSAFINTYRPNHMGIQIGTVIQRTGNKAAIRLTKPLSQYDGIRFLTSIGEDIGCMVNKLYVNHKLVNHADAFTIAEVEADGFIPKHSIVVKTSDKKQLEQLHQSYEKRHRSVKVTMHMQLLLEQPAILHVYDDLGNHLSVNSSTLVVKALKTALTKERIQQQLQKSKDTVFTVAECQIDMDEGCTLPIKEVNAMRREALSKLYELRTACRKRSIYSYQRSVTCTPLSGLYIKVMNQEQLKAAKQYPLTVYADASLFRQVQKTHPNIGYYGKRVMKEAYPKAELLICEYGGVPGENVIVDHFMNCTNSYAAAFLFAQGVKGIILSNECSEEQVRQIKKAFRERYGSEGAFITYGYGREELMLMEHCVIHTCLKDQRAKHCGLCRQNDYFLEDKKHHRYLLYGDEDCRIHLLDDCTFQTTEKTNAVYLDFHQESAKEVQDRIAYAYTLLHADTANDSDK